MTFKVLTIIVLSCLCMKVNGQRAILTATPATAILKVQRLQTGINSTAADFAPARYGDRIYFTSITSVKEKKKSATSAEFILSPPASNPGWKWS